MGRSRWGRQNSTMGRSTRRQFLEESLLAATAAALAAAGAPVWAGDLEPRRTTRPVSANERIRIACIGVHGRGKDHVSGFSHLSDVEVAAICDVDSNVVGPAMQI